MHSGFSEHGLLRIEGVLGLIPVSKSTLYRMIRDRQFPNPVKVRGCSCWPLATVLPFVKGTIQEGK